MKLSEILATTYTLVEIIARCMVSIIFLLISGFGITMSFHHLNHIEAGMWTLILIPPMLILAYISMLPINYIIGSMLRMLANSIRGTNK